MKRLALALALTAAACAPAQGPRDRGPPLRPAANPGAVVAADIAFNQLAQSKGQWTAFREAAAPGAELFVPQRARAADWLKGRADPAVSVRWSPSAVWSSCDGSYAVTAGAWSGPNSSGNYATVWQRQAKDGSYKWFLDLSLTTEVAAPAQPDMVDAKVADCKAARIPAPATKVAGDRKVGLSDDGSMLWISHVRDDGARRFTLVAMSGGEPREMLDASTPPDPPSPR